MSQSYFLLNVLTHRFDRSITHFLKGKLNLFKLKEGQIM